MRDLIYIQRKLRPRVSSLICSKPYLSDLDLYTSLQQDSLLSVEVMSQNALGLTVNIHTCAARPRYLYSCSR